MGEKLYALQVKCLEMVGFTRKSLITRPKHTTGFLILNFGSVLFCAFSQGAFVFGNINDVLSASKTACSLLSVINAGVKYVAFYFVREKVYELIDEMREMSAEAERLHPEKIGWVKKVERRVASLFMITAFATGIFYCTVPIVNIFVEVVIKKEQFNYNLPFKAILPYDTRFFPSYIITYILDYWGTHGTVVFSVGFDSLVFGLCLSIGAHYDILKVSFDGDKKKFVQTHQKLIDFSDRLRTLIKPMVLCQFSVTATLLCVIGFQLLIDGTVSGRLIAVNYAPAVTIQLFVYAAGGQILMDKSSSLTEEFYDLDKDMVIIIARSQRPSEIDAWFYKANFMNFRIVLSSAASFITVLRSFLD